MIINFYYKNAMYILKQSELDQGIGQLKISVHVLPAINNVCQEDSRAPIEKLIMDNNMLAENLFLSTAADECIS